MNVGRMFIPSVRVAWLVHLAQRLHRSGGVRAKAAIVVRYHLAAKWGVHLHCNAKVGLVRFAHPSTIVIGAGVVIEDGAVIYQGVTLGARHSRTPMYPTVRTGARIYAGATVVGPVEIGEGAIVGANSVVTADVPAWTSVAGAPARVVGQVARDAWRPTEMP